MPRLHAPQRCLEGSCFHIHRVLALHGSGHGRAGVGHSAGAGDHARRIAFGAIRAVEHQGGVVGDGAGRGQRRNLQRAGVDGGGPGEGGKKCNDWGRIDYYQRYARG